jgi:hypothetical protein
MLSSIVSFVDGSALNQWVVAAYWVWPILEILHFFGLSLLFGGLLVIDLRLAGHFRRFDPSATHSLIPVVLIGFTINLVTGILFFFGDPVTYATNLAFLLKMCLIVLAGINALFYYWKLNGQMATWTLETTPPLIAKGVAYTSLTLWTAVLLCGRLIPYVGEYLGTGN